MPSRTISRSFPRKLWWSHCGALFVAGATLFANGAAMGQQLVQNGGFEFGLSGWVKTGNFYADPVPGGGYPHTGTRYLYLSNPDQSAGNNLVGACWQDVTIPSNATSATLSYYWNVSSVDSLTVPHDVLNVTIQDTSGTFLTGVGVYSNAHQSAPGNYQLATYSLNAFIGHTIRLHFLGATDGQWPTVFRIDDVSVVAPTGVTPAAPTNLTAIGVGSDITLQWNDNAFNESGFTIERRLAVTGSWQVVATKGPCAGTCVLTYVDPSVPTGDSYDYRVKAFISGGGSSAYSNIADATSLDSPEAVMPGDGVTVPAGSVLLVWHPVAGAENYQVGVQNLITGEYAFLDEPIDDSSFEATLATGHWRWSVEAVNTSAPGMSLPSTAQHMIALAPTQPPNYGELPAPGPGQDKLIIVTHGWNTEREDLPFWTTLRQRIDDQVGPAWQVEFWDWADESNTPTPGLALGKAVSQGLKLGNEIGNQSYSHVHLIGHSAGSALISQAAYTIKASRGDATTIHLTYLDAFGGGVSINGNTNFQETYGGAANWSDHYFSRERPASWLICGLLPPLSELVTETQLQRAANIDVTKVDPDYSWFCLSTHGWPRCFYHHSADGGATGGCSTPIFDADPYGLPLAYELAGGGGATQWAAERMEEHPLNSLIELVPDGVAGGETGQPFDAWVYRSRKDLPLDLGASTTVISSPRDVSVGGDAIQMTVGSSEGSGTAWLNLSFTTDLAVNTLSFDAVFVSDPGSIAKLSYSVDGDDAGWLDLRYLGKGLSAQTVSLPALLPGSHVLTFELKQFGRGAASAAISGLRTGHGGFGPPDGRVVCRSLNLEGCSEPSPEERFVQIAAGELHGVGLRPDGSVVCWGDNRYGQSDVPPDLGLCKFIAADNWRSAAIRLNGTIATWGLDLGWTWNEEDGQFTQVALGQPDIALRDDGSIGCKPFWYCDSPNWPANVVQISATAGRACFLTEDGQVTCLNWSEGQPEVPDDLGPCLKVACGAYHTIALRADGTVACWNSPFGEFDCDVPPDLGACTDIAAGHDVSYARREDGSVVCWGFGGNCDFTSYHGGPVLQVGALPMQAFCCKATYLVPSFCLGDLNLDSIVDGNDLATLLGSWGWCSGCAADVNGDAMVDGNDLTALLGAWGSCSG